MTEQIKEQVEKIYEQVKEDKQKEGLVEKIILSIGECCDKTINHNTNQLVQIEEVAVTYVRNNYCFDFDAEFNEDIKQYIKQKRSGLYGLLSKEITKAFKKYSANENHCWNEDGGVLRYDPIKKVTHEIQQRELNATESSAKSAKNSCIISVMMLIITIIVGSCSVAGSCRKDYKFQEIEHRVHALEITNHN